MEFGTRFRNSYTIVCRKADGQNRWTERVRNLTTDAGIEEILDKFWRGSGYNAAHFVGLTAGDPAFSAMDTMAAHAGWSEADNYNGSGRPSLNLGAVSGLSVSNDAGPAVFDVVSAGTVGGAFVTTGPVKSGTSGVLIGGAAFIGGNRSVAAGDQIEITVNLSAASA
ncbi:MAG: hypothetical protein PVF65_09780 [Sphingomonadales bacterium]|jgi:hypothetical protein